MSTAAIPTPEDARSAALAPAREPASRPFRDLLWPYLRPYRGLIIGGVALNAVHGLAISFQTLMPKYLIDDVLKPGRDGLWSRLAWLCALYLLLSLVGRMLLWHLSLRLFTRAREAAMLELRARFFAHVNHLCLRFHGRHDSGELLSYLFGTPIAKVVEFCRQLSLMGPGAAIAFVSTITWVGFWDLPMCLVLLATVVVATWAMAHSELRVQRLWQEYQRVEGDTNAAVADLLRGNRAVKLHAMEAQAERSFRENVGRIAAKSYHVDVQSHLEWMKQETIGYVAFAVLCAVGALRWVQGSVTEGELVGYIGAFFALQWPLQTLFSLATLRGGARASLERIRAVLATPSATPDPVDAQEVPRRAAIELRGLTFAYEREPVLREVDLVIPYGQRVALVGPSGSGKTTLSQLVLRLIDPDHGAILVGGTDLRRCRGADLRRRFGVVPQDPFIFRTTIRDNVRVARPDADDGAIRRACGLANAWEFIERLPQGLDTVVGEGGSTLSGGQRQRLAIARALLADPDHFVFDEATSALDTLSEKLIQEAVENALGGRTAIFIAHRLATIRHCDRVVVLRDGRVVQDGTYADLAGRDGLFRDLVRGQQLLA